MEDQIILNEKDLWALNEVKACLEAAQYKLEECNDHYLARTVFLDGIYLDLNEMVNVISNIQDYSTKKKIIHHFDKEWMDTRDMWELKKA